MDQRHYLLKGTFLLTGTGLLTRTAGFFYKIFLSRTIGAAEIGRFQLTIPIFSFCMALACGGIQIAVSRFTAEYYAKKEQQAAMRMLLSSLFLAVTLALCCCGLLLAASYRVASSVLLEPSCAGLLKLIAVSLPFSAIHGCINGYFIGQKNIGDSAAAQFAEQFLRIFSVLAFYFIFSEKGKKLDASAMALGHIAGELASSLFCLRQIFFGKHSVFASDVGKKDSTVSPQMPITLQKHLRETAAGMKKMSSHIRSDLQKTVPMALPLSLNRMLICVLQSIEAALLPQMLCRFGMDNTKALAVYGTLTGMALPLIMFPGAITNSLGTLLLPAISEAKVLKEEKSIAHTTNTSFSGSLLLGFFFLSAFLLFGRSAGTLLFGNSLAGEFTQKLALLCPFLYVNITLTSILHGLGKTILTSIWSVVSFLIRLFFIIRFVPIMGIDGYFFGMVCSQGLITACALFTLKKNSVFPDTLSDTLLKSSSVCILSSISVLTLQYILPYFQKAAWIPFLTSALFYSAFFLLFSFILLLDKKARSFILRKFTIKIPG